MKAYFLFIVSLLLAANLVQAQEAGDNDKNERFSEEEAEGDDDEIKISPGLGAVTVALTPVALCTAGFCRCFSRKLGCKLAVYNATRCKGVLVCEIAISFNGWNGRQGQPIWSSRWWWGGVQFHQRILCHCRRN